jgi:hypothetical protein
LSVGKNFTNFGLINTPKAKGRPNLWLSRAEIENIRQTLNQEETFKGTRVFWAERNFKSSTI